MKITDVFPTDYPANAVVCKLWGLVGSPIEFILALSVFHTLRRSYPSWTCWVYSDEEYRQAIADEKMDCLGRFALVPNLHVNKVGAVDLAIFIPGLNKQRPLSPNATTARFRRRMRHCWRCPGSAVTRRPRSPASRSSSATRSSIPTCGGCCAAWSPVRSFPAAPRRPPNGGWPNRCFPPSPESRPGGLWA